MRIRKSSFSPISSCSLTSPSPSSCSPPSPISSCSSITTHNSLSLASSIDSSSSSSPCSSNLSKRCEGLDLLVKAIHLVTAGSVVGVPYIQRRVVRRRRRRALNFSCLIVTQFLAFDKEQEETVEMKKQVNTKARSMSKRQKRAMGLPSKYHDSVLQPLKSKTRRQRSTKINAEIGS